MSAPLRPELLPPAHRHLTYLIGAATGLGIAGVIAAVIVTARPVADPPITPPALDTPAMQPQAQLVAPEPGVAAPSSELLFTFAAGGSTYAKLADLVTDEAARAKLPRHGTPHLADEETGTAAIAVVAARDVPAPHRALLGERVRVGTGCVAEVVGFAVVARLVGDPDYTTEPGGAWTAASVMRHGDRVLAARISGCDGASYGRRAALPAIVELQPVSDADLVDAARSALLATDAARETQARWREAEGEGTWIEHADLDTRVLRHPTTGVVWISVHGNYSEGGCGAPEANIWGLFRVTGDGAIETVEARVLEDLYSIEDIVDLEGDGELELVGRDWLGTERIVMRSNGDELDRLRQHFYGCPC